MGMYIEVLNGQAKCNKLTWMWVMSYCGVEENDEADELAKQASSTPYMGQEPALEVIKTMIRGNNKYLVQQKQTKY